MPDINSSIAAGVQPTVPLGNPLDYATKAIQLRDLMQQQQLRQQQVQQSVAATADAQAQAQQRQRDLADNATVQNYQSDPDFHDAYGQAGATGDITPLAKFFSDKGTPIQNSSAYKLTTDAQNIAKNAQGLSDKELSQQEADASRVKDAIAGVAGIEDPAQKALALKTALQGIVSQPSWNKTTATLNPVIAAVNSNNLDDITEGLQNFFNKRDAVLNQVAATKQKQSDAVKAAAAAQNEQSTALVAEKNNLAEQLQGIDPNNAAAQTQLEALRAKASPQAAALIPPIADAASLKRAITVLNPEYAQKQAQTPVIQATSAATLANKGLLTPEQQQQAKQAADTLANQKQVTAIDSQKANLEAQKFALQFGGDAVKGWTETIKDNPDAAGEVPAELRTKVMQNFRNDTGLPFPKSLTGTALDQERAARNTLQRLPRIQQLMNDPDLQGSIGSLLGRLGDLSQTVGTATGLTPQQAAKGQELRTLLNNTLFGEGKAILGGRLPQQLMDKLQTTSANDHMDPNLMRGAIKATSGVANDVLDTAYQQRFGGGAHRPGGQSDVNITPAPSTRQSQGGYVVGNQYGKLDYLGGDPKDQNSWKAHQ